jgi:hypothetical protein
MIQNFVKLVLIYTTLTIVLLSSISCNSGKNDEEELFTTGFLFVLANPVNCSTRTCTCQIAPTSCIDWSNTSATLQNAQSTCTRLSGTFSNSFNCPTTQVIATCTGIQSQVNVDSPVRFYDFYSSTSSSANHSSNSSRCTSLGSSMTYIKSTNSPRVRVVNNSGSTENYTLHSSTACGGGTLIATIGSLANGATSNYFSVAEGNFAISFNAGTTCSSLILNIGNGMVRTITSGVTTYTLASTVE